MDFLVLNKVFIVAEGLLAFGTAVELFCSVHGQVSNQVGGPGKKIILGWFRRSRKWR